MRQTIEAMLLIGIVAAVSESASNASKIAKTSPQRLSLDANDDAAVVRAIRESGQSEDFLATRYVDETPMPARHPEEQQRGYVVFDRHWMDLVFPNSIPNRNEITDTLETFAAPGEYEPVTFCLRTLRECRGLQVKVDEMISPNGDRLAAPHVQIVRCVPRTWQGEEWLYKHGPVGVMNMPTYLEKARLLDVAAGRTVQYWLTVKVDDGAPPGTYQGEIRISHQRGEPYNIGIKVEVLPVKLLKPPHVLGFWDFQRPYQEEIGTLDQVYNLMREHGMNTVFARAGLFDYDEKTDSNEFGKYISIDDSGRATVTLDGSPLAKSLAACRSGFSLPGPQGWKSGACRSPV